MMANKLDVVPIDDGTVIAEDNSGQRYECCCDPGENILSNGPGADEWL